MLNPIIDSFVALLSSVVGYEIGTNEYYVVLGISLFFMCVATRILVGMFGSERGIVLTSMGVLLPIFIGGIAYALAEIYVVPKAQIGWMREYAPWLGFGLITFLTASVFAKRFFDLNGLVSVFTVILSLGVGVAGIICSGIVVEVLMTSGSNMEDREERISDEVESFHR